MSQILVHPQELRQAAEGLQAYAKKIDVALQAIDNDMLSLKRDNFLGNRANAVQVYYAPKREALLKAKEIVSHFSEDLRNTATRFEQADNAKVLSSFNSSSGTGQNLTASVLGVSGSAISDSNLISLLKDNKRLKEEYDKWMKNHSKEIDGWTLEKVERAIEDINQNISGIEKNIEDMEKFEWWKLFTHADEEYISSGEHNIEKLKGLLERYESRRALLLEKQGMESELHEQEGLIKKATSNILLDQGDSRWKGESLNNRTGEEIGSYGCLVTVLSMIARANGKDITPLDIDKWNDKHNGYFKEGSGMTPLAQEKFLSETLGKSIQRQSVSLPDIAKNLGTGVPVVLHIPSNVSDGHFVLALGTNSNGDYICADPNGGKQVTIKANQILDARVYN